jgi:uncharacterized protein (DUF305 family)
MTRFLLLGAFLLSALSLALAPAQTPSTRAQMGPMMGQPLEQLSGDAFDQAFLDQMSMHHAMAVMMARPVTVNATHQELKDLGNQIIADQTREIVEMRTWARDWYGLELPDHLGMMEAMSGDQMPMGGHHGHGGMMGGMPSGMMGEMSMMADLWKLPSNRLEVVFMSLMIPHHQGAIMMAQLVPDRAAHQELKDLASQIIASQSAEIDQLQSWLSSWYGL